MSQAAERFFLVPESEYSEAVAQHVNTYDFLEALQPRELKRARKILEILESKGLVWNSYGIVSEGVSQLDLPFGLEKFLKFSVTVDKSEQVPFRFVDFVTFCQSSGVPLDLFSKRVQRLIKKKHANVKTVQTKTSE